MLKDTHFLLTVMIIIYASKTVTSNFDHLCTYDMRPHGKCGDHLDELLEGTCGQGNFNSPDYSSYKRPNHIPGSGIQLVDMLIGKKDANLYLKKRKEYYYQGIVCECCINQCSIGELISYCLVPPEINV